MAWLFNSIIQDIGASIIYSDNAYEIWVDMKDQCAHTSSVHLFHVEEAIYECKQEVLQYQQYWKSWSFS